MLQATKAGDRWLLKSPAHLNVLPSLFKVYPDAQVVFTRRNPVEVMGSICSLVWSVSGMASDKGMDPIKIGQEQSLSWNHMLERAMADRDALPQHKDQFHDLYFSDLVADPESSIRGIYINFNLPLPDHMAQRIAKFLVENAQNKYGKHHYDLTDFGLSSVRSASASVFTNTFSGTIYRVGHPSIIGCIKRSSSFLNEVQSPVRA